jgi:hypothetical protein
MKRPSRLTVTRWLRRRSCCLINERWRVVWGEAMSAEKTRVQVPGESSAIEVKKP